MGKNNTLIAASQLFHRKVKEITPQCYSAFCLALYRYHGWSVEQIEELLEQSSAIWFECNINDIRITDLVEEETGICVINETNEVKRDINGKIIGGK